MSKLLIAALVGFALPAMASDIVVPEKKEIKKVPRAATSISKVHKLKTIDVAQLETMMQKEKDNVVIFDANNEKTRQKEGIIPGAKILPKVTDYDIALLPTTKSTNLIFYCANTMCTASHDAAKVAIKAGYTNVRVLAPGIQGWKEAGKSTEAFN